MKLFVLKIKEERRFIIGEDKEDIVIKWMMNKESIRDKALDMSQLSEDIFALRKRFRNNAKTLKITILSYDKYCKKFKKELASYKSCFNRSHAWMYFYPEGNGKTKKGYALHHKDESLKHGNPTRYHMWLPEDLVMMTRSEHQRHHAKGRMMSEDARKKCRKHMLGNKNNAGKHWFNNGTVNVRTFEAPEGFVSGIIM